MKVRPAKVSVFLGMAVLVALIGGLGGALACAASRGSGPSVVRRSEESHADFKGATAIVGASQPRKPSEDPAPKVDLQKQAAFEQAVSDVRLAMSERDLTAARNHVETAVRIAQTSADRAELARLKTMLGSLDAFWKGIRQSVSELEPGEELVLKTTRVAVVDAGRDELVVKAEGRLHSWHIEQIPTSVVMAITAKSFGKDAASKVIVGTFLAVDPKGDRARARQLWQEATRAGIDTEQLMPELEGGFAGGAGPGTLKTAPPTDEALLRKAERAVRKTFQNQYAKATSAGKKLDLARELLDRGSETADNAELRFVILREAKDLAIAGGDPVLACRAIDQMAKLYTIDPIGMKLHALEAIGKRSRGLSVQRELAIIALALLEEAVEAEHPGVAGRLSALAIAAARKSRSASLLKQAIAARQRFQKEPPGN